MHLPIDWGELNLLSLDITTLDKIQPLENISILQAMEDLFSS